MERGISRIRPRQVAAVAGLIADASEGKDVPTTLDLMASRLREVLQADGIAVELERDSSLVCCYASGHSRRWLGRDEPVAGSLAGLCYGASEPLLTSDVSRDRRLAARAGSEPEVHSLISVPLRLHGAIVGVLRALSGTPRAFSGEHLVICRLTGAAMQRVLMHELWHEQKHGLDRLTTAGLWALRDRRKRQVRRAGEPGYQVSVVRLEISGYLSSEVLGHVSMLVRSTDQCLREDAGAYSVIMPGTSPEDAENAARRIKRELESFAAAAGDSVTIECHVESVIGEVDRQIA